MGMNTKNTEEEIVAEINMTPLIDVMLVLLIIFMVSSSAAIESGLDVNLPEISAVSDKTDATLVVSLSKDGEIAVQGKKAKLAELEASIKEGLTSLKTESVVLEGDAESNLEAAMQVMDIARNAGAKNFSIAAKLKSK